MCNGLTEKARQEQLFNTPFVRNFVTVYHKLGTWRAKRQHLCMFAPHYPVEVTRSLFGISRWKVYCAKLHYGTLW